MTTVASINYASPPPGRPKRKRRRLLIVLGIGMAVLVGMSVLLPTLCRSSETANRVKCESNLRQIAQAIQIYADEHHGQYPDTLATLLLNVDVTSEVFVCPSSNDQKAEAPTTQAVADELSKPGHLSYIYLGDGFTTTTMPSTAVLLYEPLTNHGGKIMNICFGDGHVEYFAANSALQMIEKQTASLKK